MPKFTVERHVAHIAEEMFDLVAEVEAYPRFVPLCQGLTVKARSGGDGGKEVVVADMTVAYAMVRETFATRSTLDRVALAIDVTYLSGPFSHLEARWTFVPAGEGTSIVGFAIDYEFRSRLLATLMGAAFDRAFRKLVDAFEARANAVYGARALA